MKRRITRVVVACLIATLVYSCGRSNSGSGVSSNSAEYGRAATDFIEYVENHPDLLAAYNTTSGQSMEAWGQSHYCSFGRNEGRAFSGTADCSENTPCPDASYEAYADKYSDVLAIFQSDPRSDSKSMVGRTHYTNFGQAEGRTVPNCSGSGGGVSSTAAGSSGGSYEAYVNKYPDLLAAFNSNPGGLSKSAWGQAHYTGNGQREGRTLPATTGSSSSSVTTACSSASYEAYVNKYPDLLAVFHQDPRGDSKSNVGKEHYSNLGKSEGRTVPTCGSATDASSSSSSTKAGGGGDSGSKTAICGNGSLESGEQCDDGNTKDGDGCDEGCRIEGGGKSKNNAPTLSLGTAGTVFYAAGDPPINPIVTGNVTLEDADDSNMSSAVISIIDNHDPTTDILAVIDAAPISSSYSSTPDRGVLTLTGNDSLANYKAVLGTLSFEAAGTPVVSNNRTIEVILYDGGAGGASFTEKSNAEMITIKVKGTPKCGNSILETGETCDYSKSKCSAYVEDLVLFDNAQRYFDGLQCINNCTEEIDGFDFRHTMVGGMNNWFLYDKESGEGCHVLNGCPEYPDTSVGGRCSLDGHVGTKGPGLP